MTDTLTEIAKKIATANNVLVLVGAGLSKESGIPTFRGEEGIWIKNSKNYFPEDLATYATFTETPEILWEWYNYRREICSTAHPNKGHYALAELEQLLQKEQKNLTLITQNVDNLSIRAGSKKLYEIHGNIFKMRCSKKHTDHEYDIFPVKESQEIPKCKICGALMRPHVLWFDEYYNDALFYSETAIRQSYITDILIIIGTTLATTLPYNIVRNVILRQIPIAEINPNPVFTSQIDWVIKGTATDILPKLVQRVKEQL